MQQVTVPGRMHAVGRLVTGRCVGYNVGEEVGGVLEGADVVGSFVGEEERVGESDGTDVGD